MSAGRFLSALFILLAPLACTTKGSGYAYLPTTGSAGTGGSGTVTPTTSVMVTITAINNTDPTMLPPIAASSILKVTATVTDDSTTDLIDASSVRVTFASLVGDAAAAVAASTGQLASAGNGTFSGMISLGNLPTGSYQLTVTAQSNSGVMAHPATATLTISGGPTLIVQSPTEGQPVSHSVSIEILVDQGANAPTALLAGMALTLMGPMQDAM